MSNLIKSQNVYVNGEGRKIIDSNGKREEIHTLVFNHPIKHSADNMNIDNTTTADNDSGIFKEGLNAAVIDQIITEEEESELRNQAQKIIEDAREEADRIISEAKSEADKQSKLLFEEASLKGYEDGLLKSMSETDQIKKELKELEQKLHNDYLSQIEQIEPLISQIIADLVKKITGIAVEDKLDVILYLIHNAIIKADNSKSYIIRVSKVDYDLVASKKEELMSITEGDVTVEISVDKDLVKNQCLIETDTRIIDCSLDGQLDNLIQDIKLLSKEKE